MSAKLIPLAELPPIKKGRITARVARRKLRGAKIKTKDNHYEFTPAEAKKVTKLLGA